MVLRTWGGMSPAFRSQRVSSTLFGYGNLAEGYAI